MTRIMKNKFIWLLISAALCYACTSKNDPENAADDAQQGKAYLPDSSLYYSQDILQSKDVYFYNSDGRQDKKEHYEYNPDSHQWIVSNKTEYSNWNSKGEYCQYIESIPAESGWTPTVRYTRTFDSSGKVSSESYETREGDSWQNNLQYKYTYTPQGDVELRESWYYYNDVVYYSALKNQYFYRTDLIDSLYCFTRSSETDSYILESKTVYPKYDSNGNRTEEITYSYSNNEWIPSTRLQVSYDSKNNLLGGSSYTWRNNNWVINGESTISYKYLEDTDLITEYSEQNTYYDEDGNKTRYSSYTMKHFYSKH